ncbi:MAG: TrbI/VirB10 family protein [Nostoc sp. DedQUE12a]|nr:TrbI/VirB10 family protein [Nostoc sp. DedQUE12a]
MTQYSIPTETPPPNLLTLDTDDRQLQIEYDDWESRMARLVGFEEESSSLHQTSEDPAREQPSSEPDEVKTEQPLSSNPFAKLGLVGAATLAVVLVAGVFLSQLMSGSNQKPRNNLVTPQVRSQPTNETTSQQLQGEIETLKTKLALTEQAQSVKAAQERLRTPKPTSTVALAEPSVSSTRRQQVIPTPPPTAYVPQPVTIERIVKVPAPQPLVTPQLPVLRPNTQPVVTITPPPPPNPFDEWTKLAKLGSYGQVNVTEQPNNIAAAPQPTNETQPPQETPNPNPGEQQPPPPQQGPAEVSQAQPQGQNTVAIGTSAKAVLATAIFGETTRGGNNEEQTDKNVFVVRLKEPLKAANGEVALPANTEFLTEIRSISEQGLVQMNVVKVISQNDGNLTERSLPNNSIVIRGAKGRPLIGNRFPGQSSSVASMDLGLFVLGGIGKAAELLNRTDGQVVTINGGSTVVSNTNTGENLPAGIVEGGLNSVVPQIAQRNQQAIAQMSQQTNVWFLPAGTNIELYVNQATQF